GHRGARRGCRARRRGASTEIAAATLWRGAGLREGARTRSGMRERGSAAGERGLVRRCWGAFAVSVLLHGAIGGLVLLGADDEAAREERVAPAGSWMASTVEVGMADVLGAATEAGSGRSGSRAPGDGASAGLDEDQAASPEVVEGVPAMAAGEGPETPGEDPGAPTKADRTAETRRAPGENRQKAEAGDGSRAARETEASSRSGAAGEATPSRAG